MKKAEWQDFLPVTQKPVRVLCIDEMFELSAILEKLPKAQVYSTVDMLFAGGGSSVRIEWQDRKKCELPVEMHFFDYILAGEFANKIDNKNVFFQQMHLYLKENGSILAKFFNVRHWKRLEEMFRGQTIYPDLERKTIFWKDLVHTIEHCGYPEIQAFCAYDKMPDTLILPVDASVFDFIEAEQDISYWWIKACCIDEIADELMAAFTPELRQQMVFLLRRIEHDIEVEKNCQSYWQLCDSWKVLPSYTTLLANNSLGDANKVLLQLAVCAESEKHRWQAIVLLQEWYEKDGINHPILCYVLAGLFYLQKDYRAAEQVVLDSACRTQELEELLMQIRREK